ncbi:MAG: hypothetical protein R2939_17665 [Kofleriaceae bacterium]
MTAWIRTASFLAAVALSPACKQAGGGLGDARVSGGGDDGGGTGVDGGGTGVDAGVDGADAGVVDQPDAAPMGADPFEIVQAPPSTGIRNYGPGGTPPVIVFNNGNRPATCRAGNNAMFATIAATACPAPMPDGTVIYPVPPTPGATDGTYTVEVIYEDPTGTPQTYTEEFYLHRSLIDAEPCGPVEPDWPSDDAFFAAATAPYTFPAGRWLPPWADVDTRIGSLPHTATFTTADTVGPYYELGFRDVVLPWATRYWDGVALGLLAELTPQTFTAPAVSLRHRIGVNGDGTLAIIHRTYESRAVRTNLDQHWCTMGLQLGSDQNFGSDWSKLQCDAIVLNAAGEGVCLLRDGAGVPQVSVLATNMVQKVLRGAGYGHEPGVKTESVWGPKVFDATGTYSDDLVVVPLGQPNQRFVIMRP